MDAIRTFFERIKTAAILLSGMIPLVLQPGPVAGEVVAARHVDRLLDEYPVTDGELPNEVALQCHLISLVSDAVTLRAAEIKSETCGGPLPDSGDGARSVEDDWAEGLLDQGILRGVVIDYHVSESSIRLPEQPRGP